jgi:hypothetical protein
LFEGKQSTADGRESAIAKVLRGEIPAHEGSAVVGDDYFLPGGWVGEMELHPERIARYPDDSFVIIEAMDTS